MPRVRTSASSHGQRKHSQTYQPTCQASPAARCLGHLSCTPSVLGVSTRSPQQLPQPTSTPPARFISIYSNFHQLFLQRSTLLLAQRPSGKALISTFRLLRKRSKLSYARYVLRLPLRVCLICSSPPKTELGPGLRLLEILDTIRNCLQGPRRRSYRISLSGAIGSANGVDWVLGFLWS